MSNRQIGAHGVSGDSFASEPPTLTGAPANGFAGSELHAHLQPGTVLANRYNVIELLGEGGMGAVYKAEDLKLKRVVALKVIRAEHTQDRTIVERFKQELVLAREVSHHNVVRLYDIAEWNGIEFITMELVEGEDLATILRHQGKLAPREAADIVQQVCRGLQAVHEQGIIHRDLKPGNIMRDQHSRIVLMDFGLARIAAHESITQTGALVGTMEYVSPEQVKGIPIDPRSDLFAVGLIFYELLTGEHPYKSDSVLATLVKRTRERPEPPKSRDGAIPGPISHICAKCLEIDPARRYQSSTELLAELEAWMHPTKAKRRILWPAVALGSVVIAAMLLAMILLRSHPKPIAAHPPVSVLVADFQNNTGEAVFDETLEPMLNVALEGASFLNAFNRGQARKLARKLPNPSEKLDEKTARLVAVSQGLSTVISGELNRREGEYIISATALDAVTGKVLAKTEATAANKDQVLQAIPKLAAPIRKVLGDATPESVQMEEAGGAFTAASLEVVHAYSIAMDEQFAGKAEEAFQSFAKAAELDPRFARAYSGMAAMASNLGRTQDFEKYIKVALEHVDRMSEREAYRVRSVYYVRKGSFQKCVEESTEALNRYPADNVLLSNLAGCNMELRNFPEAVKAGQRAVELAPKAALQRINLSFFNIYAGDFGAAEREARAAVEINPSFENAYHALAEAQLGQGNITEAAATYARLKEMSPLGASFAVSGRADLALYEGRFSEAARILEQEGAADLTAHSPESAANRFAVLAYVQLARNQRALARTAAERALANSQSTKIRFLAARTYLETGDIARAQALADSLSSELQPEPQAYGKIVAGGAALGRGDARQAIELITAADKLLDSWIGHFELGRAYLQAGLVVEADAEFVRCIRRRGEAMELFFDDVNTFGYLPEVYYYQGRAREALKSSGFADSYQTYLDIRGEAGEDPLLPEIRKRIARGRV